MGVYCLHNTEYTTVNLFVNFVVKTAETFLRFGMTFKVSK